jgi:hypothetical protein
MIPRINDISCKYAYHIPNIIKKMNQKIISLKYSKVEYFNLFHKYGIILFIPKKVIYFWYEKLLKRFREI